MAGRAPKKPDSAPKKPAAKAAKPLKPSQIKGKKLARNVDKGNAPVVQSSSGDLLKVLRDRGNTEMAAEMVRRFADEADPSKPGYEGNEIVANFVKAFQQLPTARRQELLDAAGNPAIFQGLPNEFDPLEGVKLPERRNTLERDLDAAIEEARANRAEASVTEAEEPAMDITSLRRSPSTFAGHRFKGAHRGEGRAPIDREVPSQIKDKETGEMRDLTPEEVAAAEKKLIKGIVGAKQMAQYDAIVDDGKTPMLPRMGKAGGRPSRAEMDAIEKQNARTRPPGTSKASMDALKGEVSRIRKLPVDPDMEPFAHVVDTRVPLDNKDLDALKQLANQEKAALYKAADAALPEDQLDGLRVDGPRPVQAFLDDVLAGNPINLEERTGLPPELQTGLYASKMASDPIFSEAAPTAVPSQDIKDNMIGRLKDQMADIRRRRAAFIQNPNGPGSNQADNLDTLTVGTLGLQGPYSKGMNVDQQLAMSTQSPNAALMDDMYRAFAQMGLADEGLDVGDIGEEGIRTVRGGGPSAQAFDLNKIPEAFYHYAIPDENGNLQLMPNAPTADFLADQLIGWRGIQDPDEFRRIAIPVLEASLAAHHRLGPRSVPAMRAASTVMVPSFDPRSNGYAFFSSPEGKAYIERAFDPSRPMTRMTPTKFTGDMNATLGTPSPMSTESKSLDELLNMSVEDAKDIDLREFLNAPDAERPLDLDTPNDYKPLDLDEPSDLDSRFSAMPLRGGNGLHLPMNSARRGPLSGLIA